jgi:hypothetical protein
VCDKSIALWDTWFHSPVLCVDYRALRSTSAVPRGPASSQVQLDHDQSCDFVEFDGDSRAVTTAERANPPKQCAESDHTFACPGSSFRGMLLRERWAAHMARRLHQQVAPLCRGAVIIASRSFGAWIGVPHAPPMSGCGIAPDEDIASNTCQSRHESNSHCWT